MSHADDYLRLSHELLRRRWKEGPLPDEEEGRYAERLDDIWTEMTAKEHEDYERWARSNRLHGVVFLELGQWVARLLGHDYTGMSTTSKREAIAELLSAMERELARAHRESDVPFDDKAPSGDFIDWAVAGLIHRFALRGVRDLSDELCLVECEGAPEAWTLYVLGLD